MQLYRVRKYNSGFTLIEMITVVIIVGVIAAIAAPNLLGMLNRSRLDEAMRQVAGGLKEVRKQAENRGKACKIKFVTKTIDGKSRQAINVSDSTYSGCLLSERIMPVNVSVNTGTITDITFSGRGNIDAASAGTIVLSHSGTSTQKCVQIEGALGNILTGIYVDTDNDGTADDCETKS